MANDYDCRISNAVEAYYATASVRAGFSSPAFYDLCDQFDVEPGDLEDAVWYEADIQWQDRFYGRD